MRHSLALGLAMLATSAFAAVAPDGAPMDENYHSCANLDCSIYVSRKFSLEKSPLSGGSVYGETFFSGDTKKHRLLFKPQKIEYVFNPSTGQVYSEGSDYKVTDDGIEIIEGGSIKSAPAGYIDSMPEQDRQLYGVKVTPEFQQYQYAVTYRKDDVFAVRVYGSLGSHSNLLGKQPTAVTWFGDSITEGANATSSYAAPNQPGYAGLVMARLNEMNPGMWQYRNNSVGGWSTRNAAAAVSYRVMDKPSDLIILAFGMNDSNGITPSEYHENLAKVITSIRSTQPSVPVLLVSGTLANPASSIQKPEALRQYLGELEKITGEFTDVAAVDVSSLWELLLKRKSFYDVTGNGLNHPNDFGHRLLADAVLIALGR